MFEMGCAGAWGRTPARGWLGSGAGSLPNLACVRASGLARYARYRALRSAGVVLPAVRRALAGGRDAVSFRCLKRGARALGDERPHGGGLARALGPSQTRPALGPVVWRDTEGP